MKPLLLLLPLLLCACGPQPKGLNPVTQADCEKFSTSQEKVCGDTVTGKLYGSGFFLDTSTMQTLEPAQTTEVGYCTVISRGRYRTAGGCEFKIEGGHLCDGLIQPGHTVPGCVL